MITVESNTKEGRYNVRLTSSIANLFLVGAVGLVKTRPSLRILIVVAGLFLAFLGGVLFYIGTVDVVVAGLKFHLRGSSASIAIVAGFGLLLIANLSTNKFNIFIGSPKEVEEREKAEEEVGTSPDPYSSLELAQKRLNEYYAINQSQARGSFRWAVFAMFIGLSTIVAGVWLFYLRDTPSTFLTSLSTAAGVVINSISGLYLYLHNKTQRRALFYYNQLVRLQNLGLAIRLAESHEDSTQKAKSKNKVIDEILNVVRTTAIDESKAIASEVD